MDFRTFERAARAAFDEIPDEYKAGVDGLVVEKRAEPHPRFPGIFTLGVCETEDWAGDYVSPETLRSTIRLYWGSFRGLSLNSVDFDWKAEIQETVEHELRHHLEALAGEDALEDVDDAMEMLFRRSEGEPWDPWFFRWGTRAGSGVWVVEDHVFLELEIPKDVDPAGVDELVAEWRGREFAVAMPPRLGDLTFIQLWGLEDEEPPYVELVVVLERSWWARAKSVFGGTATKVMEYEGEIGWLDEPTGDDGGR